MNELGRKPCCRTCRGQAPFHFCQNDQCAKCHAKQSQSDSGSRITYADPTADAVIGRTN